MVRPLLGHFRKVNRGGLFREVNIEVGRWSL